MDKVLFSNYEAALYLAVSPNQLRLSRHTGELFKGVPTPKFMKFGNAVRYRKWDLDNWVSKYPVYNSNADFNSQVHQAAGHSTSNTSVARH